MITDVHRISGEKFVDYENARIIITCVGASYTATLYSSPTPDFPDGRLEKQITRKSKTEAITDILQSSIEVPVDKIVTQDQIEDRS
jgi:hypothetical protein